MMEDTSILLGFKQKIIEVDQLIRKNEELQLILAEKEVSEQGSQTDVPKRRNFSTQTESSDDKSEHTKPRPRISFFNNKNPFAKKQKKRVKFFKKGPLHMEDNVTLALNHSSWLPGFLPLQSTTETEYVLPNASQMSQILKRIHSPEGKKSSKKAKKAKLDSPTKTSPKKTSQKKKKDVSPARKPGKESKKYPAFQAFESRTNQSQFQVSKDGNDGYNMSNKPENNRVEQSQQMDISDQISSPEVKSPPTVKVSSKHTPQKQSEEKLLILQPRKTPELPPSSRIPTNIEPRLKLPEIHPTKNNDEPQPEKPVETTKSKLLAKNNHEFGGIIALGKSHCTPMQRTERRANFNLTPEAMKAALARKVQQTAPKKPTMPAPIHSGKRPSLDNPMDPAQRKKFAPSRLCPSAKQGYTLTAEAEENKDQSVSSSKEVKTQSKVANFASNLNKNQVSKDREKADSERVEKNGLAKGSGSTSEQAMPNFSGKDIDVNQDLLLSDDEDSEDDQILSPTKSFKRKRNGIVDDDLDGNPATLNTAKQDQDQTTHIPMQDTNQEEDSDDTLGEDFFHANDDFETTIDNNADQEKTEKDSITETDSKSNILPDKVLGSDEKQQTLMPKLENATSNDSQFDGKINVTNTNTGLEKSKNIEPAKSPVKSAPGFWLSSGSFLEYLIKNFKKKNEARKQALLVKFGNAKFPTDYDKQLANNLVLAQFGRLWQVTDFDTINSISNLLSKDPTNEAKRRLIYQHIYMEVREEKEWEDVENFNGPMMTTKQAKLLTLLVNLEPKMPGIMKQLQEFFREAMFGTGIMSYKLYQLSNLTRFLLLTTRHLGDEEMARDFLYDTLFFRNTRAHCMITVLLDTWPEIFLEPNDGPDILFEAIIWVILHSGPATSLTDMKVPEVKQKLKEIGIYQPKSITGDDMIKQIIDYVEEKHDLKLQRYYATKALLLISRVQDWSWSHNHIVVRLLNILSENYNGTSAKTRNLIHWVVDTVGQVLRVYPAKARDEITQLFESIQTLIKENSVDADLEEACLRAIIWTGHHLQYQVCKFLQEWQPRFHLRTEMEEFLFNFVGTRASSFAEKTNVKHKKISARNKRYKNHNMVQK